MKRAATTLLAVGIMASMGMAMTFAADTEMTLPVDAIAYKNVTYVDRPSGPVKLDLFLPAGKTNVPLVIYIHGGGWRTGGRAEWPHMNFLVGQGYAVANLGYRLTTVAPFPAQIDDCLAALDYLLAHGSQYGIDITRIAVTGESAGGHLATLVGMHRSAKQIKAVIDLFGPVDLVEMKKAGKLKDSFEPLFGGPLEDHLDLAKDASPINHVAADNPPFLIFHGTKDPLVPIEQSKQLAAALKFAGVSATLDILDGAGHAGPEFWTPPQRQKMTDFLRQTLK